MDAWEVQGDGTVEHRVILGGYGQDAKSAQAPFLHIFKLVSRSEDCVQMQCIVFVLHMNHTLNSFMYSIAPIEDEQRAIHRQARLVQVRPS
jgi:hypothetical protein